MRNVLALVLAIVAAGAFGGTATASNARIAAAPDQVEAKQDAQKCPGHPNALGTSRELVVDFADYPRIGSYQYPKTLPLADHEVVLTFDDGPLPPYSDEILDILAAQCVKATYFLVGRMARQFPATVRRIYEDGHTIGTHSQDHPRFRRLSVARIRGEIDEGIASVATALGDPRELAPFFRIPGLARTDEAETELAARSLVAFSIDTSGDDWRHISPKQIIARAMRRLEARGSGILLLHDIHRATVAALPGLLKELKEKGFRIVHAVAAPTHEPPAIIAEPAKPDPDAAAQHTQIDTDALGLRPSFDANVPGPAVSGTTPDTAADTHHPASDVPPSVPPSNMP